MLNRIVIARRWIWPQKISSRLYGLAGLALLTVAVLALAAMHFVTLAGATALHIRESVLVKLAKVNELEVLLERHRRLIETAPIELDRRRVEELKLISSDTLTGMWDLSAHLDPSFSQALAVRLPPLGEQSKTVLMLAANYAQAEAIEQVDIYSTLADDIQQQLVLYKSAQIGEVNSDVSRIVASGAVLAWWVTVGAGVALVLIGPFSLIITMQIVRRLKRMTATMDRLAANDTSVHVSGGKYQDELGEMARAMGVFKSNAIALKAYQSELEALNLRFEFALENMSRGLSMFDRHERLIVCNQHYRDMYGLSEQMVQPGTRFRDILDQRIAVGTGRIGEIVGGTHLAWPIDEPDVLTGEMVTLLHTLADGRTIQVALQPLKGGGWVALHGDITEERRQDALIERLAHVDAVTGIANRYAFQHALERVLRDETEKTSIAIHLIDLDRFKAVNDTFGHPVGDRLLQQVADRLTQAVRVEDCVARLGGDEFAIIQQNFREVSDADALAERLIQLVSAPYVLGEAMVEIGASIGVVIGGVHGSKVDELLRNADIALYRSKSDGRGRHVMFHSDIEHELKARRKLEADLLVAISDNRFELNYQPIIDLESGEVVVCEALLRWNHPELGPISPAVFIPVAESSGAISQLGAWVLERACQDALLWPSDIKVAVNLSALQFQSGQLFETVGAILAHTGFPAGRLEFEITESVLLRDDVTNLELLHRLRQLGISIALDDFGTGYASLSYLRSFPFDKIKIDQSFIRGLPSQSECVAIVRAVTDLAKTLGMKTVAEGVETIDHLARVKAAGCDQAQGYLLSRPVPMSKLASALEAASLEWQAAA
jgi:diguanylate cyclase (GGDEF)-like protein